MFVCLCVYPFHALCWKTWRKRNAIIPLLFLPYHLAIQAEKGWAEHEQLFWIKYIYYYALHLFFCTTCRLTLLRKTSSQIIFILETALTCLKFFQPSFVAFLSMYAYCIKKYLRLVKKKRIPWLFQVVLLLVFFLLHHHQPKGTIFPTKNDCKKRKQGKKTGNGKDRNNTRS